MTETAEKNISIQNEEQMMAGSYLVTVDDYDTMSNPRLIDRSVFSQLTYKNKSFSKSAQVTSEEYGSDFKKPEYPLQFLSGLLELNLFHYNCCEMVALDCVKNGWDIKVSGSDDDTAKKAKEELGTWFNSMSNSINEVLEHAIFDHEAIGVTGLEIIRTGGLGSPIERFEPFHAQYAKLHKDGKRVLQEINNKKTWFILYGENYDDNDNPLSLDRETGEWSKTPINPDREAHEVLWFYEYKTGANEYGSARITKALDIIELEVGRTNFNIKFFENYGLPAFAVYITGQFKDEEQKKYLPDGSLNPNFDVTKTLRYRIAQQIKEVIKNPHSAVVISIPTRQGNDVNVHFVPLSTDIKEASFRLMRQDNKDDICSAHKISSDLVGVASKGTLAGSVLEETQGVYNENKVSPKQKTFTNKINKLIKQEVGITFMNDMTNITWELVDYLKRDIDGEVDRVIKLMDNGLIKPVDAQRKLAKLVGITVDTENEYLDEYMYKGQPLFMVFNRIEDNIFDYNEYSLKKVEEELMGVARRYLDNDGISSSSKDNAGTRIPDSLKKIIEKHTRRGR